MEATKKKKGTRFLTAVLIAALACGFVAAAIFLLVIPGAKYGAAVSLFEEGKYADAADGFKALGGFRDSEKRREDCYIALCGEERYAYIKNIKAGDTYIFGKYEQDGDSSDGKEDLEWTVLDKDGISLLLVSKYAIDAGQFNTSKEGADWEHCSLRKRLNTDFADSAFSEEEKGKLEDRGSDGDPERVFLLSVEEAEKYFENDPARRCAPTAYAVMNGALASGVEDFFGNGWWWLRDAGTSPGTAAAVYVDGSVRLRGDAVTLGHFSVRPAIWIDAGK